MPQKTTRSWKVERTQYTTHSLQRIIDSHQKLKKKQLEEIFKQVSLLFLEIQTGKVREVKESVFSFKRFLHKIKGKQVIVLNLCSLSESTNQEQIY